MIIIGSQEESCEMFGRLEPYTVPHLENSDSPSVHCVMCSLHIALI